MSQAEPAGSAPASPAIAAPAPSPELGWRSPWWLAPLLLAGLIWFSHFYWCNKFGIYEDDYFCIEPHMNFWKFKDVRSNVYAAFEHYIQGRPLMFAFGHTLAWASTKPGGGFERAYVLAFGVTLINAWLMLLVARRAVGPRFAPLAAAVFALAPADTTHPFLHVCFYVQPAVAFMLLSLLAYQSGWRVLRLFSYLPAAATLITYESCFLPLLLAPFLAAEAPRVRRVVFHWAIMGALLVTAMAVRSHYGESRMKQEMSDRAVLTQKVKRLATLGPVTSLEAFVKKPVSAAERVSDPGYFRGDGLRPLGAAWATFAAAAAGVLLLATGAIRKETVPRGQLVRVALAGLAMLPVAYPVLLNREPTVLEGRMSSVHIAAAPGWALIAGALLGLALSVLPRPGRRALWVATAAYIGVLVGYHVTVQRDYARGWADQRRFWDQIARLCPDLDDDTVILYPYPRQTLPAVVVNSHADYLLPGRMFLKHPHWTNPPIAAHVGIHCTGGVPYDYAGYDWSKFKEVGVEDGKLVLLHWTGRKMPLKPGNVIAVYPDETGRYHRVTGTLDMCGVRLPLKEPAAPNPNVVPFYLRWQFMAPDL